MLILNSFIQNFVITIRVDTGKPFFNSVYKLYLCNYLCFRAKDILNIAIISTEEAGKRIAESQTQSKVIVKRPIAKRPGRSASECTPPPIVPVGLQIQPNLKKLVESTFHVEIPTNGKVGPG